MSLMDVFSCRLVCQCSLPAEMAEGDWDEVTIIRKRAPKAGQLKTPQVTISFSDANVLSLLREL